VSKFTPQAIFWRSCGRSGALVEVATLYKPWLDADADRNGVAGMPPA
jgi:hypothetical protein